MSLPLSLPLSLEQENGALAKARKKNRLAQRKHRQRMRSLNTTSSGRDKGIFETTPWQQRTESVEKHPQSVYNHNDGDDTPNCVHVPIDSGSRHVYYAASPLINTATDPSLYAMDFSLVNPDIWTSSKALGALIGSSIQAPLSLDCNGKAQQPPTNDCLTAFNDPLLPVDADKPSPSRHPQTSHGVREYSYESASRIPFSNVSDQLALDINQTSPSQVVESASPFRSGYDGPTKDRRDSNASCASASPKSSKSNTSVWSAHGTSATTHSNSGSGTALSKPPLYVVVQAPCPDSPSAMTHTNPFAHCLFQSTVPMPSTPRAVSLQHNLNNDQVSRFKKVLEAIDDAGFDSLDSMAAAYYTSVFPTGSPVHSAQALSKKRHLKRLLTTLHESAKTWDEQETQNFREGIMQSAEDILIDEMQSLDLNILKRGGNNEIIGRLESLFFDKESFEATKENKMVFKHRKRGVY
ncbi:hypothetical protein F4677DRAFT_442972 [Hypoxylon crocopeplum]|nr:hypothetical protein F4677DRAFT_442972 [Hypoxylon crocopeplum]